MPEQILRVIARGPGRLPPLRRTLARKLSKASLAAATALLALAAVATPAPAAERYVSYDLGHGWRYKLSAKTNQLLLQYDYLLDQMEAPHVGAPLRFNRLLAMDADGFIDSDGNRVITWEEARTALRRAEQRYRREVLGIEPPSEGLGKSGSPIVETGKSTLGSKPAGGRTAATRTAAARDDSKQTIPSPATAARATPSPTTAARANRSPATAARATPSPTTATQANRSPATAARAPVTPATATRVASADAQTRPKPHGTTTGSVEAAIPTRLSSNAPPGNTSGTGAKAPTASSAKPTAQPRQRLRTGSLPASRPVDDSAARSQQLAARSSNGAPLLALKPRYSWRPWQDRPGHITPRSAQLKRARARPAPPPPPAALSGIEATSPFTGKTYNGRPAVDPDFSALPALTTGSWR